MRVPSMDWLSAEVGSEFPVMRGVQAEVRQRLGRVFQRWFLGGSQDYMTLEPCHLWAPWFYSEWRCSWLQLEQTIPNPTSLGSSAVSSSLPGLDHRMESANVFSAHAPRSYPELLHTAAASSALCPTAGTRPGQDDFLKISWKSTHMWEMETGRKTSVFPQSPSGKKEAGRQQPQ